MNLIYNENKYILKIEKDDICIGNIQESILKTCSLMIYNIENTEFFLKNGKSFILGSEQCIFKEKMSIFIKKNVDEITIPDNETINYLEKIDKFIVYDRKRDEKGNVIKNNIIIDNYNIWFEENENQKYLSQTSVYNDQSMNQNNNIISLFTNIFENSLLNHQNNNDYINNLFRNYINNTDNNNTDNNNTGNITDYNIEPINIIRTSDVENTDLTEEDNKTINEEEKIEKEDELDEEDKTETINNEFSNMVNIFDTYINNSEREQYINNNRNSILYNYFNNIYSTVNNRNQENNNQDEEPINNDVNEFITENNINSFINNSPILNIFRTISSNIEIDEPTIVNSNDDYITFNIPISIYNNNNQHNFEDIVVSLTEDEFSELTCYECNEENNQKECNICIECFDKGNNIVKLNCNHEFHKDCIKKWLCDNSTKCPVCRVEVAKGKANL